MPAEHNKQVLRDLLQKVDDGDLEGALAFYAPDYQDHDASEARDGDDQLHALRHAFAQFYGAFSETRHCLDDVIAEGEMVAARISVVARHTGPIFGLTPTGRLIHNDSIVIYRFENGRIRERWCRERHTTRALLSAAVSAG
jgi:predicted ester cyclase